MTSTTSTAEALERAWSVHWARLLALLVAQFRRFDLVEDSLQEAFVAAARTWPEGGVPDNPPGWLLTSARRRAIDRLRAEAIADRSTPMLVVHDEASRAASAVDPADLVSEPIRDEQLLMMFTCCHPALAPKSAAALTLRYVGGLRLTEIARLFLVAEPTMAARLTRAKHKIVDAGIPFASPPAHRLDERLDTVLAVIYLIFTEGYSPTDAPGPLRIDLAAEAIRLGRALDDMLARRPAVQSLLALMLLQHARRDARTDPSGRLVLLADQDRTCWHAGEISEGLALLDTACESGGLDEGSKSAQRYRLQAQIAAEHATARLAADTDWTTIAEHYGQLEALTGSPIVRLNRAVAVGEAFGPAAALGLLDGLDEALPRSHRLAAVRAELLTRLARVDEALAAFDQAIDLVRNGAERAHLTARRANVAGSGP